MKTVNGNLVYRQDGQKVVVGLQTEVPEDTSWREWSLTLRDMGQKLLEPTGVTLGDVTYRVDGGTGPLKWWQVVADWWYRVTWRGQPYTGSRFIIIWPRPMGA